VSTFGYYIATESTKGKNTREALTSAKVRKSQARKNAAVMRAANVDAAHSSKLDKRMSNKAQKLAKREAKRAGLVY
jgi:hypothetical protein